MSRSKRVKKRTIDPDPAYKSRIVAKLINRSMVDGKKDVSRRHVYQAIENLGKKVKGKEPIEAFRIALENIKPQMEVRSRRVGGASYQVPVPVKGKRKKSLAVRWLVKSARRRRSAEHKSFADKLTAELMDAYHKQGGAVSRKEQVEKMARANKAFAHFRW